MLRRDPRAVPRVRAHLATPAVETVDFSVLSGVYIRIGYGWFAVDGRLQRSERSGTTFVLLVRLCGSLHLSC